MNNNAQVIWGPGKAQFLWLMESDVKGMASRFIPITFLSHKPQELSKKNLLVSMRSNKQSLQ